MPKLKSKSGPNISLAAAIYAKRRLSTVIMGEAQQSILASLLRFIHIQCIGALNATYCHTHKAIIDKKCQYPYTKIFFKKLSQAQTAFCWGLVVVSLLSFVSGSVQTQQYILTKD